MGKIRHVLVIGMIAACAASSWGEVAQTNTTLRLAIDLADGSHIIGIPKIESVSVQTAYAKMDIPLKQITSVKMEDDHETASLDLSNGDKLKGVLTLKPLDLTTVFGPVKVGIEHLRTIVVSSGNGTLSKGMLDEVMIFNRALSAEEVKLICRAQRTGAF